MEGHEAGGRDRELSQLYHALMNPMTVVLGYAQLLSTRRDLDPDVRDQVLKILSEARECVRIIEAARAGRSGAAAPAATPSAGAAGAPGVDVRRRVLVVDDEVVIQKLASEALGRDNDVVAVGTADDALKRLLSEDFDAVLLDLSLGGETSGRTLYETLQARQPEMAERVVFVTGGITDPDVQDFVTRTGRDCLQKPFHLRTLREVVARVADR